MNKTELIATIKEGRAHELDLRCANLRDADLRCANLRDADLRDANLRDANLRDADLRDTTWDGIQITGMPSGDGLLIPMPQGWVTSIGCWQNKELAYFDWQVSGKVVCLGCLRSERS